MYPSPPPSLQHTRAPPPPLAGTTNDGLGDGCTPCSAATAKASVGSGTCDACAAGTYAQGGNSDCLPCPAGTYGKDAGYCTDCPAGTYSWVPGSTACLFCAAGVPKCKSGFGFKLNGVACSDSDAVSTASEGSTVLTIASGGAGLKSGFGAPNAGLNAYALPALFSTCSATVTLSVVVSYVSALAPAAALRCAAGCGCACAVLRRKPPTAPPCVPRRLQDCSVDITPMSDTTCAEPGATGYSYDDLAISGYYASKTAITTLLPSVAAATSSSYLLTLTPNAAANTLDIKYLAASTDPAKATLAALNSVSVAGTVTVNSGIDLAGKAEANAACPAGSYASGASCYAW